MASRVVHARAAGEAFLAKVTNHTVEVRRGPDAPPTTVETQYLGHGRVALRVDGASRIAWVVEDGDTRWVHCDGEVLRVEIEARATRRARSRGPDDPPALSAPMPATVVRVVAPVGTAVRRGAVVLLLEAMKMEMPLRAPLDGTVTAIHCREGELVQPNVVLVEMQEGGN